MSGSAPTCLAAAVIVTMCLAAVPASAQQPRGSRLPSGLFGGGVGDAGQMLGLGLSAGGGYHSTVQVDQALPPAATSFGYMAGNLRYSYVRPRVNLFAQAASSARYYSGATRQFPARHAGGGGASFDIPLSGRTSLTLTQTVTYQPLQTVSTIPGLVDPAFGVSEALPIDPDLATTGDGFAAYSSTASVGYQLSRRTAASLDAAYTRSGRVSGTGNLSTVRGGGRLTRELARGLRARVGYGYARGTYADATTTTQFDHHQIDAGVDYNRALSLTRHTTLSFGTGSTVLTDRARHRFTLTGRARLSHDIGRSWQTSVSYRRGADFLGTLRAPVVADSVSAGLNGFLGQRMHAHVAVGASRGNIGLSQGNSFTSHYRTAGLTVGLAQYLGVDVTYAEYQSDFGSASLLTPGVPNHFQGRSVRASIRLWAPLLTRVRRLNVAR